MTHDTKRAAYRSLAPVAALLAALALAGCSTGHIGESWQCPLAEGGTCDSVAAADPAVPEAAGTAVLAEPLWRVRAAEPDMPPARGPGQAPAAPCSADCGDGFDPFAWLARLFAAESAPGAGAEDGEGAGPAATGSGAEPAGAASESAAEAAGSSSAPSGTEPAPADPAAALLPAGPGAAPDGPEAGDLRTDEVVARIWIAPFVDADGVYREASHVRVVLEPAGWRLGR